MNFSMNKMQWMASGVIKTKAEVHFALHGPLILKGQGGPICSAHLPIFLVGSIGFKI